MASRTQDPFTERARALLRRAGDDLHRRGSPAVAEALDFLDTLPAGAVVRADLVVRLEARLYHSPVRIPGRFLGGLLSRRAGNPPDPDPDFAPILLFHGDGRVREGALNLLDGPVRSPFFFGAIALRLNDWAPPVRAAAAAAAARVFPATPAATVADAALSLLGASRLWRRWGPEEALLDAAFSREDVAAGLADRLAAARHGPMPSVLRHALRRSGMDAHLPMLAADAVIPGVRAVALRALIERRALWSAGFERQWVDRSMGVWRRKRVFAERPVATSLEAEPLVLAGAHDRSALVRKVAAEALSRRHTELANAEEVLALLVDDPNLSVRGSAAFIARARSGAGA
ncbi:MAG TPA: hypothetical protein VEZ20_06795 [Allosphingosinicella sp.]|nr:hypothetical protein [Allosphingosinicella sp.]